jgi:hypothetical protein
MDSFDHYVTLSQKGWITSPWARDGNGGFIGGGGRSGNCFNSGAGGYAGGQEGSLIGIPSTTTVIVGVAVGMSAPPASNQAILSFGYSTNVMNVHLVESPLGEIIAYRPDPNHVLEPSHWTELGRSGAGVFPIGWHYLEAKVKIDSSTGSVEVRVNGTTVLNLTNVNTYTGWYPATVTSVLLCGMNCNSNQFTYFYFDDLYICDPSGSDNNGFLGDCRVECLFPTGAGAETQWTPSAGVNWENVNETPPDGDTTYNRSNTPGQADTYAMADLVSTTGRIYAAQYLQYARKDNAGSRTVAPVARIGGVDYAGASVSVGDSYAYYRDIHAVSPATAAAFTISEVNAMEYGTKVVA